MTRRRVGGSHRLTWGSLATEIAWGLVQRPVRSILTASGTAIGVASFVVVMGLTGTANAQISAAFDERSATEVSVTRVVDAGDGNPSQVISHAGLERARSIIGVEEIGSQQEWIAGATVRLHTDPAASASAVAPVVAVDDGYWAVSDPALLRGRTTVGQVPRARLAVVGDAVAEAIGLGSLPGPRYVYLDGVQFVVAGVVSGSDRDPRMAGSVYVDVATADTIFGAPRGASPAGLIVAVNVGAAPVVARQIAVALDPVHPERFDVAPVSEPTQIRDRVSDGMSRLFLLLAGVALLIGALGIANTTLVAVLARRGEIGLRRAMGALPRQIVLQMLGESALLGAAGGLLGGVVGLLTTTGVALGNEWTAVLPGWAMICAPLIGAVTGLLAGLYPAAIAARMEPLQALRTD